MDRSGRCPPAEGCGWTTAGCRGRPSRSPRPGWARVGRRRAGRGGTDSGDTDRGGATVCLLVVGLVFVLVGVFGAAIGSARVARHQARAAADFAALAAAGLALRGDAAACVAADELASANGARLTGCRLDGFDALVTVEVPVSPLPGFHRAATATARAGPIRD
ncbi:Rv3654c family TadE-like protein [Micromonospora citrea]|uniref:Rv3654c family TadE-like protein n=1 Tax=Micromonospora citrea TaxID=47855 RepID=UPI003C3F0A6E